VTDAQIVRRCMNCGLTKKGHASRGKTCWKPWTVELYRSALDYARLTANLNQRVAALTGQGGNEDGKNETVGR